MRRDRARLRPWLLALAAAVVLIAGGADALASGSACAFQPGGLPDAMCTPGAIDPRVTQDNIHETICRAGYTSRARWTADDQLLWPTDAGYQQAPALRPPTSYTNGL